MPRWLVAIVIGSSLFRLSPGQNLREAAEFADNEYISGRYESAVREYQRVLIFSTDSLNPDLLRQIGRSFDSLGDLDHARDFYSRACQDYTSDSLKLECKFDRFLVQIKQKKYFSTLDELSELPDSLDAYFRHRCMLFSGYCCWGINRYEEALKWFRNCIPGQDSEKMQNLFILENEITQPKHPYPKLAALLSIIPGLGQVYAGNLISGINSLALCSGIALVGLASLSLFQTPVIFVNLFPWFQRYYIGGFILARDQALARIEERKYNVFQDVLNTLSDYQQ